MNNPSMTRKKGTAIKIQKMVSISISSKCVFSIVQSPYIFFLSTNNTALADHSIQHLKELSEKADGSEDMDSLT